MTALQWTLRVRRLGAPALVAGLLTTGCELADTVAPTLETRVVVHAVLNPLATVQVVLVEKTLRSLPLNPGLLPFT